MTFPSTIKISLRNTHQPRVRTRARLGAVRQLKGRISAVALPFAAKVEENPTHIPDPLALSIHRTRGSVFEEIANVADHVWNNFILGHIPAPDVDFPSFTQLTPEAVWVDVPRGRREISIA